MRRSFVRSAATVSALALAAAFTSSAEATFFSFASDSNQIGYTFRGSPVAGSNSFKLINDSVNGFDLLVALNNNGIPAVEVPVNFVADLTATAVSSSQLFPGSSAWRHSYIVSGSFQFVDRNTGALLVRVDLGSNSPSLMTVPGTQDTWATAGAVLGSDSFSDVQYTITSDYVNKIGGAAAAAQFGISIPAGQTQVTSINPDDFGFDLTVLNSGVQGAVVALNAAFVPTTNFFSEGSFSGHTTVPTPGALALAGLGGLLIARRRRA